MRYKTTLRFLTTACMSFSWVTFHKNAISNSIKRGHFMTVSLIFLFFFWILMDTELIAVKFSHLHNVSTLAENDKQLLPILVQVLESIVVHAFARSKLDLHTRTVFLLPNISQHILQQDKKKHIKESSKISFFFNNLYFSPGVVSSCAWLYQLGNV